MMYSKYLLYTISLCYSMHIICMAPVAYTIGNATIELRVQNIVKMMDVEAIVNAANANLAAGGGVCGAIYSAAGITALDQLVAQARTAANITGALPVGDALLSGVPTNSSLAQNGITSIIHAVGPNCSAGENIQLLRNAYQNSLTIANNNSIKSIAFPFISSAIFGCDPTQCAQIASQAIVDSLKSGTVITKVVLVFWGNANPQTDLNLFKAAFDKLLAKKPLPAPAPTTLVADLKSLELSLNNLAAQLNNH